MASFRTAAWTTAIAALLVGPGAQAAETIVWWAPNWQQARAEAVVKDFHAANPDIDVKLEITVADGLQNRVMTTLRGGSPPDVIEANSTWTVAFAATGALIDLDDWAQRVKLDRADFLPAALKLASWKGKLYGLPYRAHGLGMIYNKGLYREAGLDPDKPPQTWPELLSAAKALTRLNAKGAQQYGLGIVGGGEVFNMLSNALPFIWMNGGDLVSADGRTAVANQPAAVEGAAFYTSLYTAEGVTPPSTLQNDGLALRRLFVNGTIAQYFGGQFDLPVIQQEAPGIEFGVAPLPHPPGKASTSLLGSWCFMVPKQSRHIEASLKLLAFLAQPTVMGAYTDTFPARISAMSLPRFDAPLLQGYRKLVADTRATPAIPAWVQIIQVFYDQMQQILLKRASPQEAMDQAQRKMQALLDKQG